MIYLFIFLLKSVDFYGCIFFYTCIFFCTEIKFIVLVVLQIANVKILRATVQKNLYNE